MLINTIKDYDYSRVDDRCLFNDGGCIVDLGCSGWDWSNFFIGKKRVIGVDPYESKIEGVEFFEGLVGPVNGNVKLYRDGAFSTCCGSLNLSDEEFIREFPMLNWKNFCKNFNIEKVSVLKINIEGTEYSLLNSMDSEDYSKIDQIVVSFHDDNKNNLLKSCLFLLEKENYNLQLINSNWNWYLAIKN